MTERSELIKRQTAPLATPSDIDPQAVQDITGALNALLADVFALYLKTKNFHWHMSGPHFRDFHLLLDDHGDQIFSMTDDIAERVRKIGGTTIRSIGHIARLQRVLDNDAEYVTPTDMLSEGTDLDDPVIRHGQKADRYVLAASFAGDDEVVKLGCRSLEHSPIIANKRRICHCGSNHKVDE